MLVTVHSGYAPGSRRAITIRATSRRLYKPEIVTDILLHNALLGHRAQQCCCVALTWDTGDRAFFRDSDVGEDRLPVFLDADGNNCDNDAKDSMHLGPTAVDEAIDLLNRRTVREASPQASKGRSQGAEEEAGCS